MPIVLPNSDDTVANWSVTPMGSYWSAVDDVSPADVDYVASPPTDVLASDPLIFGLDTPITSIGNHVINIRAKASTVNISRIRVTLLNDSYVNVTAPMWITLTSTIYTDYSVMVYLFSAPATKIKIEAGNTAPGGDPYYSNVSLLINGNGAEGSTNIVDNSSFATTQTVGGNARITLTEPSFPNGCLIFDGTDDWVDCPHTYNRDIHTTSNIGTTTNWTVEFDIKLSSTSGGTIFAKGYPSTSDITSGGFMVSFTSYIRLEVGSYYAGVSNYASYRSTPTYTVNVLRHVAIEITNGTPSIAVNGVIQAGGYNFGNLTTFRTAFAKNVNYPLTLGSTQSVPGIPSRTLFLNGKLARIRETTGISRYGGVGFTPPSGLLPTF